MSTLDFINVSDTYNHMGVGPLQNAINSIQYDIDHLMGEIRVHNLTPMDEQRPIKMRGVYANLKRLQDLHAGLISLQTVNDTRLAQWEER